MSSQTYNDPIDALDAIEALYQTESRRLREQFAQFANGKVLGRTGIRGYYPFVRIEVDSLRATPMTRSYGFCDRAGTL